MSRLVAQQVGQISRPSAGAVPLGGAFLTQGARHLVPLVKAARLRSRRFRASYGEVSP